eukprot:2234396-Amphidinium_carterae.2
MFRNDKQQRDIRELQDYISKVITFLEAWENVPKNHQPNWYKAARANYIVTTTLLNAYNGSSLSMETPRSGFLLCLMPDCR